MDKASFFKATIYFSVTMLATGMVMNVSKIAIVDGLGDPGFLGLMSSISIAVVLVSDVLLSYLADTRSRRYAAAFAAICWSAYAIAFVEITPLIMVFAAVVHGLGTSLQNGLPGAIAMEAIPNKEMRLKWLARMDISMLLAVLAGNGLGILLFSYHASTLFVMTAGLMVLVAVSAPFMISKNRIQSVSKAEVGRFKGIRDTLAIVFSNRESWIAFGFSIVSKVAFMAIQTYWIVYYAVDWNFSDKSTLYPLLLVSSLVIASQVVGNGIISLFSIEKIAKYVVPFSTLVLLLALMFPSISLVFAGLIFVSFLIGKLCMHLSFVFFQNKIESEYRGTFSSIVSTVASLFGIAVVLRIVPALEDFYLVTLAVLIGATLVAYAVLSALVVAQAKEQNEAIKSE